MTTGQSGRHIDLGPPPGYVAPPALPLAKCRYHRDLFDSDEPDDIDQAIQICHECREYEPCARWADSLPPRCLRGVVGGKFHTYKFRSTP